MEQGHYLVTVSLQPITLEVWADDEPDAKWRAANMVGGAGLSAAGTFCVTACKREDSSPLSETAA